MKPKLYEEVVLVIDVPEKNLKKGDVATVVAHHPISDGKDGYTLEVFNALGDTITIVTVPESAIDLLTENEVLAVRSLIAA
ncbi:conserved hypothetical protein [Desulfamplus magnetovallimortis]|uniref:DUF4926 domain-containing protein n=1 Tax=Desulfamplus magnetovallimortis TaxID=1246637 RepID=A0A1W1H859_9BACT|nr:DUF4926 domain-containing protein [Desulfamplus magnetovallimortis]SLM28670.1 conserved hypothetical protein [Desulfamplus magnetovallimortis]